MPIRCFMLPTHASPRKPSARSHELGWKAQHVLLSGVSSISAVLRPAGLAASTGAVTAFWLKSTEDHIWDVDADMGAYRAFMKQWAPNDDIEESVFPYATAHIIVEVLKKCGDDLSRENLIRQATNIQGLQLPLFLPGLSINITPSNRIGWREGADGALRRHQMGTAR